MSEPGEGPAGPGGARGGLTSAQAASRLAHDGYNDLPQDAPRSWLRLLRDVLSEPMFALLMAAALVYLVIGDRADALVLGAFATVSILITVIQEGRSQRVLEALRDLSSPRALLMRDGVAVRVPGREVVVGDLLLLKEGDRVAADGVLLSGSGMQVDESLLTGESLPVGKHAAAVGGPAAQVFSGTLVVRGHGRVNVTATGGRSEIGRIGIALKSTAAAAPRLQVQIGTLVRRLGLTGLFVSLAVVALLGFVQHNWLEGVLGGIAVGMSMLPEEFPLVLTVFMVMGAWRLSRSRVLTRRTSTIETLGAATVLCTDKTGTLTYNRIGVQLLLAGQERWAPMEGAQELSARPGIRRLLLQARRASDESAYDPIDAAVLALPVHDDPAQWQPVRDYPMQPGRPWVGRAWRSAQQGGTQVAIKGAPEAVALACGLGASELQPLLAEASALAANGARVLAVAASSASPGAPPEDALHAPLEMLGLVAFADPIRETVPAAVRECREAGIRVVMITGDHPGTARAIAREAGLDDIGLLTGLQIDELDDARLQAGVRGTSIFARITPRQKLRIVEALQAGGEVVAMTGDGVNDAPALKRADIGIAMGARGSDVAREASDLVLLDDDFGAIVKAVRVGRRIYDNLRKALVYILAVHVPIAGLALLPLLAGWPMLLTPMIVALLEIIIDPACSIVLEAEPEDENVMRRPPRPPDAKLFGRHLTRWSLTQGGLALAAVLSCVGYIAAQGATIERLRSAALLSLVGANLVLIQVNRRLGSRGAALSMGSNPPFLIALVLAASLMIVVIGWPTMRGFMNLGAPTGGDVIAAAVSAFALLVALEGLRRITSARAR
ncbi:MAG: cation-translocating P-type ATPase [Steroidobacteraceae bacterium]